MHDDVEIVDNGVTTGWRRSFFSFVAVNVGKAGKYEDDVDDDDDNVEGDGRFGVCSGGWKTLEETGVGGVTDDDDCVGLFGLGDG